MKDPPIDPAEEIEISNMERMIQSTPLKQPSSECDAKVLAELALLEHHKTKETKEEPVATTIAAPSLFQLNATYSLLSTAVALLIGFMLGTYLDFTPKKANPNSEGTGFDQQVAGYELSDNIEVVEGESKTIIVADSIQMQNNLPVRKLETVTHKKVRVKNSDNQSETEMNIPIRKVFFTLAETI